MGKEYIIKKLSSDEAKSPNVWDSVNQAKIESYAWDDNNYRPKATAKVFYTDTHFHVKLIAFEKQIRAVNTKMNGSVYMDSCLEFFVNMNPLKDDRYLNFETNSVGAMLLGIGKDRGSRIRVTDEAVFNLFSIKASVKPEEVKDYKDDCWSVEYSIPFSYLEKIYGKLDFTSGKKLKGNFYKCGDETKYPHWGSWNEINTPNPDFHVPECFGDLILE